MEGDPDTGSAAATSTRVRAETDEPRPGRMAQRPQSLEEEDMDPEPLLNYQRLTGGVAALLETEDASALAAHEHCLVIGTSKGTVAVFDLEGAELHRFASHTGRVNAVCIDKQGDFVASCSDDGSVVLRSLDGEETAKYTYNTPLYALALDPKFSKKGSRQFCCGGQDGQLVVNVRGWFSAKDVVLHANEGAIYAVTWHGALIAWANEKGVKVYDFQEEQRVAYVDRPLSSAPPGRHRCHLEWVSEACLAIAWGDFVKVCAVRERPDNAAPHRASVDPEVLPPKYVEIVQMYKTDFIMSGFASMDDRTLLLSHWTTSSADDGGPCPPELRVIGPEHEELCSDALAVRDFEKIRPRDTLLVTMPDAAMYFVVTPHDIVMASQRTPDDHVTWLIDNGDFEGAMEYASENSASLEQYSESLIGEKFLRALVDSKELDEAVARLPHIAGTNAKIWMHWIPVLASHGRAADLFPILPVREDSVIHRQVYEDLLIEYLTDEPRLFLLGLDRWPTSLYDPAALAARVEQAIEAGNGDEASSRDVQAGLAELYLRANRAKDALAVYIRLRDSRALEIIQRAELFDVVRERLLELVQISQRKTMRMLSACEDHISMSEALEAFADYPQYTHAYLAIQFARDKELSQEQHNALVESYCKYEPEEFMSFLRRSNGYSLEHALRVAEKHGDFASHVYVLQRMGSHREALDIALQKAADVALGIAVVRESGDEHMWDILIDECMANGKLILDLLDKSGGAVDPRQVIERIPKGLEIEGLRDRIAFIVREFGLDISLRKTCARILHADALVLMDELLGYRRRGVRPQLRSCPLCGASLCGAPGSNSRRTSTTGSQQSSGGIVTFAQTNGCTYHRECLEQVCLHAGHEHGSEHLWDVARAHPSTLS